MSAANVFTAANALNKRIVQVTGANTQIDVSGYRGPTSVELTSNATISLTSAPMITGAVDGQRVRLINTGNNLITIRNDSALGLPGSGLMLGANSIALGRGQVIDLEYVASLGKFVQTSTLLSIL